MIKRLKVLSKVERLKSSDATTSLGRVGTFHDFVERPSNAAETVSAILQLFGSNKLKEKYL